jgi:zinc transport system ATP-binding protein
LRLCGSNPEIEVGMSASPLLMLTGLSGGQYQLLCVWAALTGGANLVLLDEPTNNLDPNHESVLAEMLKD